MRQKIKTLDFMIASVIFAVAIVEFISWIICNRENYTGPISGSEYLLFYYPLTTTIELWLFALFFIFKIIKFNACVYTQIIVVVFFIIQSFNISAYIFQFGIEFYNLYIYPIFLCTIQALTILKVVRWVSFKHS